MHTISYLYKLCPRCSALFAAWSVASFSLYLLHLSLSPALFILVWQMNLGQKLWKLKWVPPVEGDHCTNLNFRAMMKPKKEREKKATKKLPQNISHVSVACGQSWSHKRSAVTAKGERKKGCHRFATHTFNWSSELQFYFRFRIDVPHMPHVARTIPSFLHRTHSIEHAVSLSSPSLSLSLFILSFSIFGAHLQARPDNNKRDTKNVTQDLRRFLVAFSPPTSHYI